MPARPATPHPLNAAGPFYVENAECISCRVPETLAPDMIGFDPDQQHCYFKKQPETEAELERTVQAFAANCCGSYQYAGSDPDIKKKLQAAGASLAITNKESVVTRIARKLGLR